MFYFWIRRQVRKVMEPLPQHKAQFYSNFFTYAYLITGWTLFGSAVFLIMNQHKKKSTALWGYTDEEGAQNSGFWYGKAFRAENMKIYTMQGFSVTKDGDYKYAEDPEAQEQERKDFYGDED